MYEKDRQTGDLPGSVYNITYHSPAQMFASG